MAEGMITLGLGSSPGGLETFLLMGLSPSVTAEEATPYTGVQLQTVAGDISLNEPAGAIQLQTGLSIRMGA